MRKRCAEILMRLRKSKNIVWFNSPIDVEGLKLHSYRAIIRSPMNLGTLKQNAAGRYPSREASAGDVRLIFNNTLRYNPPHHHVHRISREHPGFRMVLTSPVSDIRFCKFSSRFAGLGTGLAEGKLSALSPFLSDQNAERVALALCRMRGAALKVGKMLSIQDKSFVPPPVLVALDIVRQGADVMPRKQLNSVLDAELGPDWSSKLRSFDYEPLVASIEQAISSPCTCRPHHRLSTAGRPQPVAALIAH